MITIERYHDICCGHRVVGHESKCQHLHGHNYRFFFTITAPELDGIGRIIDFSCVKNTICEWLENNWDHKFLMYIQDPLLPLLKEASPDSIVVTEFNPTAENIAKYLVEIVGPEQLHGTGCILKSCKVEETRKCSATYSI